MEPGPLRPRKRPVGDFADEDVAEGDDAPARGPDEVAVEEGVDGEIDRSLGQPLLEGWKCPWLERSANHGAELDGAPRGRLERIEAGQPFEVAGSGLRGGVDFVAADGRYLGGESRDSTSMTITLTIQAMTIPRTQVSKTTVSVLP